MLWNTGVLKNPENGYDFQPLTIFQAETETWVCSRDVPWATDYDNICVQAAW